MCCSCCAEFRRRLDALEAMALSPETRAFLAALWPIVAAEWGTEPWTLRELRQRPNVRLVLGTRSPASIGRLFATAAGRTLGGFELENVTSSGSRVLWRLWRREAV